jgi:phage baseplate assembly protein W
MLVMFAPHPPMATITTPSTPYPAITAPYQSARLQRLGNEGIGTDTLGQVLTDYDDLAQSIKIILTTPKGSDPLRPEFASNIYRLIDRPLAEVRLLLIREIFEALRNFEPRIAVVSAEVREGPTLDSILAVVTWRANGRDVTTQVALTQ